MKKKEPDYRRIYEDIIAVKFPEKKEKCARILLGKEDLSALQVLELNTIIFCKEVTKESQKLRSYKKSDILEILDYQKQNKLNNSQLALYFKLSRNTVAKWKKMFLV